MSRPKILINGCGITYQGTNGHKTWPSVLKVLGFDIVDISGPAVSNQWILNKTFLTLLDDPSINIAVVQLTTIGKLDVEVDCDKTETLVANDSLRNFVIKPNRTVIQISPQETIDVPIGSIWPSSHSLDHPAKQLWREFLYSPNLEVEDIFCKLMMMEHYCRHKKINLLVFQGYDLPWKPNQLNSLCHVLKNAKKSFFQEYKESFYYQYHDHKDQNTVPCFQYQIQIAKKIASDLDLDEVLNKKLSNIEQIYAKR